MVRVDNSANTRGDGRDKREELPKSFKLSLSTTDGSKREKPPEWTENQWKALEDKDSIVIAKKFSVLEFIFFFLYGQNLSLQLLLKGRYSKRIQFLNKRH